MIGGDLIGEVLQRQGVRFLFTLCGGHISPILLGAKNRGVRVVDVRHEVNAVFAADAVARLTGTPGVAAVTAGPGVTNTITAVKNAQLAQSPVVLLGGATGTLLKGRGSLQDIDQMALFEPHVKWAGSASRVRQLVPLLEHAFDVAQEGVPGPVFLECPVDLLYEESLVRGMYGAKAAGSGSRSSAARALQTYLNFHLNRLFAGAADVQPRPEPSRPAVPQATRGEVRAAWRRLSKARQPLLMVGSQATLGAEEIDRLAEAVGGLGIPVYLSGMARGLLGRGHPLQLRHQRRKALGEADLVILAGVPADFRLDYGRQISSRTEVISINRSREDLYKNRRPSLAILADPGRFLCSLSEMAELAEAATPGAKETATGSEWLEQLRQRDEEREAQIRQTAGQETVYVNPLDLCAKIDECLAADSVLVADGGDFVATASYIAAPRGPLSWLDPGVFGTLGVGAGFALGAKLCRPTAEVWIFYGDGSAAYSLAEFDTFVRHEVPVIAVVGNDASWAQIAREQIEVLQDDVGTVLRRTDYHRVAEGYGGKGIQITQPEKIEAALAEAKRLAADGHPVLVNALLGTTDFRKGSISM